MSTRTGLRKLFQPDNNGPDDQLLAESYPDNPVRYLHHRDESGDLAGTVEIGPGWQDASGTFRADGPVFEWSWIHYHAAGDRTRHDHRIVHEPDDEGVTVRHQHRKREVLGVGRRDEHGWRTIEAWRLDTAGVRSLTDRGSQQ